MTGREDGWQPGAPNSALPPRNGNGDGRPGLSVPDCGALAFALALAASGEPRALPEAALSASLWYADDQPRGSLARIEPTPFSFFSPSRSLCALVCIVINRPTRVDVVLRQGQRLRRLALSTRLRLAPPSSLHLGVVIRKIENYSAGDIAVYELAAALMSEGRDEIAHFLAHGAI